MKKLLNFIKEEMKKAGIDYHYQRNKQSPPRYPYHVGNLIPVTADSEDGRREFTLFLDGFTRKTASSSGDLLELLEDAEKIETHFPVVGGLSAVLGNQAVLVNYVGCQAIDSGDEQLQRVQTTLQVKLWKGTGE